MSKLLQVATIVAGTLLASTASAEVIPSDFDLATYQQERAVDTPRRSERIVGFELPSAERPAFVNESGPFETAFGLNKARISSLINWNHHMSDSIMTRRKIFFGFQGTLILDSRN